MDEVEVFDLTKPLTNPFTIIDMPNIFSVFCKEDEFLNAIDLLSKPMPDHFGLMSYKVRLSRIPKILNSSLICDQTFRRFLKNFNLEFYWQFAEYRLLYSKETSAFIFITVYAKCVRRWIVFTRCGIFQCRIFKTGFELLRNMILKDQRIKSRVLTMFTSTDKREITLLEQAVTYIGMGQQKSLFPAILSIGKTVSIPKQVMANVCYILLFEL